MDREQRARRPIRMRGETAEKGLVARCPVSAEDIIYAGVRGNPWTPLSQLPWRPAAELYRAVAQRE